MTWKENYIAEPMGYEHCVLFDCARDAVSAYHSVTEKPLGLPENICPELVQHMREDGHKVILGQVNPLTGLAKGSVHLYGYQAEHGGADLALDPLMTGWIRRLTTPSAVISFGRKKMVSMGYGGAFLTNDSHLARLMEPLEYWNTDYTDLLISVLPKLKEYRLKRFDTIDLWDRYLGDTLLRIPAEQLMPWRVMRRAHSRLERDSIVKALRGAQFDVGTNYPPLTGRNEWGDTVLNFRCSPEQDPEEIRTICNLVERVVHAHG